jgi:hypothetical protein
MYSSYRPVPRPPARLSVSNVIKILNEATQEAQDHLNAYHTAGYISDGEKHARETMIEFVKLKMQDKLYEFDRTAKPVRSQNRITKLKNKKT